MVSKPFPSPSSSLRRIASAVGARRYVIACVCLLIVAGALRFYDLGAHEMRYDEAVTALNSRGAASDLIENVRYSVINDIRYGNTSPILYPLALWAVQRVESSEFSVRLISAVAGTLTVGALLLLMPCAGVARRAAFLAALLAAVSVHAILHSQGSREYALGMLCAALMIAGLLQYLRDGRKALLCGALLVGPLLQYGLVLFGAAALAAAALAPGAASRMAADSGGRRVLAAAVWRWLKRRLGLALPVGCFAAGCGLSWALTARYQWADGGFSNVGYLADYYYHGGYDDAASMLAFLSGRAWDLAGFLMPPAIAAVALLAFGAIALAWAARRRRLDAIALLALFGVGIAVCGALAGAYPFGGSQHNLYLGPIIFLAAGGALHSVAGDAAALLQRAWVAPALAGAVVAAIALAGAAAIRQSDLYYADASTKRALAVVGERAREGDGVYTPYGKVPAVSFYTGEKPANYFYSKTPCWGADRRGEIRAECDSRMLYDMLRAFNETGRVWLLYDAGVSLPKETTAHSREAALGDGHTALHLIGRFDELAAAIRGETLSMHDALESAAPSAAADYNLYLRDDALYYARRPCVSADTDARFFLHIYPTDAAILPALRRQSGFANLDFEFDFYGIRDGDRCVIRRALPGYPIERIHTGQFVSGAPPVWEAEIWIGSSESG